MIIIVMIRFLGLTGCSPKTYDEINYNKLHKLIDQKKDFIMFIGQTDCSACRSYKITINALVENYGLDIKYIDAKKLTDEQSDYLLEHFPFDSTPTTVFVKNGKEVNDEDRIIGNQKYSKVEEILKEKGYIK